MDSEAQDATQSLVSSTRSKIVKNRKRILSGFLFSLLLHSFCFYGIYIISKKVFEVLASREKVFRFTLIGGIPGEKKSSKTSDNSELKSTAPTQISPGKNTSETNPSSSSTDIAPPDTGASKSGRIDLYVRYPQISKLLGEEGEVVFVKDSSDTGIRYRKLRSSGHRRLDEAAEKVLNSESQMHTGKVSESEIEQVRFVFKLNDDQSM